MTLLLDTSILIDLERGNPTTRKKLSQLAQTHPTQPFISFMTTVEFLVGLEKLSLQKKTRMQEFLWKFTTLHTTNETGLLLSTLKHRYDKKDKKKTLTNLFIASQAAEHQLTLVTKDNNFEDIKEIQTIIL